MIMRKIKSDLKVKKFMKKRLKIIGIVFIGIIALAVVFFIWNSHRQLLSKDYYKKIKTGGEIEKKYSGYGTYETAYFEQVVLESYKKYEIWYPKEMTEKNLKYPVIVINNGTGMYASRQMAAYERLASWGFIVIGNEEEYSWNGFAANMSLQYLIRANEQLDSLFYGHIDEGKIGVTGHSQGGAACIKTVTETNYAHLYRAAFLVSPTVPELAASLEWDYDISKVTVPIAIIAGTGDADANLITPLDGLTQMYETASNAPFVMIARKTGYDHGETSVQSDGYMTAWFRYWLCGDEEAKNAFLGESPEILQNELYENQKINS